MKYLATLKNFLFLILKVLFSRPKYKLSKNQNKKKTKKLLKLSKWTPLAAITASQILDILSTKDWK